MGLLYVGAKGFDMAFTSQEDLTVMTSVTMEITRHGRRIENAFAAADFNTVGVGDDLVYTVLEDDIDQPGWYTFQVIAEKSGAKLLFAPLVVKVRG